MASKGCSTSTCIYSLRLGQQRTWQTIWQQPVIDYVNEPNSPIRLAAHAQWCRNASTACAKGARRPSAAKTAARRSKHASHYLDLPARTGQAVRLPLGAA
ncbi:MAG: hypothetical protein U0Z44_20770 [Kouleothrix sp.]